MNTEMSRPSATIYQFPVGGRRAFGVRHDEANVAAEIAVPRLSGDAIGGAWYHDAAIQDTKRAGDR